MSKNSYGTCQCGENFKIPGLEFSLCPRCGWIRTPKPEKPKAVAQKSIREIEIKLKPKSDRQLNLLGGDL